ncbi:hypothetical protein [Algoriphagus formosus]|uniref:Uncharacterized protein n=1 Tax=Algoriphagus formosus TaxID=2007308 RepID=A0A4R5VEA6_9BACT|nr:hypothetical protein [Algoriphagus aquimaris]TDK50617.1 hypothetical protein E1898_00835 [Algoriphagus aquimaris]
MNQQFFHIASVNVVHEYSGEGLFNGLSFSPTTEAKLLAQNLNIVFKPFSGGLHILSAAPDLLQGEEAKLCFDVFNSNPLFFNFTDFGGSFRPDLRVFYFSIDPERSDRGNLHQGDFVSLSDGLEVLQKHGIRDLQSRLNGGEIKLYDEDHQGVSIIEFNRFFSGESSVFMVEGQEGRKTYYKPSSKMGKTPFGLLTLECSELFNSFKQSEVPVQYTIRFKSQKTIWRYVLSDDIYEKFNRLSIIDTQNQDFLFHESEFQIQGDRKVRSFESQTALPFLENVSPKFQLVEKVNGGEDLKVVIKQLPKASPEVLNRKAPNDDTIVSQIFI